MVMWGKEPNMPDKMKQVLTSRRFWVLVMALLAVGTGVAQNQITYFQGLETGVAALAAYMVSLSIDPGQPTDQSKKG